MSGQRALQYYMYMPARGGPPRAHTHSHSGDTRALVSSRPRKHTCNVAATARAAHDLQGRSIVL